MADDFTAKFSVDISELKRGIQDATKQIKTANATFKAETAGMDDWTKNADGLSKKLTQLKDVLQAQKSMLANYNKQLEIENKNHDEASKKVETLTAELKALKDKGVKSTDAEYKKLNAELKAAKDQLDRSGKAVDSLNGKILKQKGDIAATEKEVNKFTQAQKDLEREENSLTSKIEKQEKELEKLKRDYIDTAAAQGKDSAEAKELASKIQKLNEELKSNRTAVKNAEKDFDKLSDSVEQSGEQAATAGDGFTTFKGILSNFIGGVVRDGIQKLKELGKATYEAGATFESSMSKVAAISGAQGDELNALTEKAKEMGEKTVFSATESANAFEYMSMAGWKTEDMLNGIEGIMNLAAASGEDLATTSDIVTDALTAMGYSAGDAGKIADVMAAASANANTNVGLMGSTFQYAAPLVGSLGYSMEDTAVAIGLMANAGIKGDKAGTSLRSTLSRLAAPPKAAAEEMDRLNISLTDNEGKIKPLRTLIDDLRDKFKGLSESEQTAAAKNIAGANAMSGFLAIVNSAPEDYQKLIKAVDESTGAAKTMADTMNDNVAGSMTLLNSQIEGIKIQVFNSLKPAFREGIKSASNFLKSVNWSKFGDIVKKAFNKFIDALKWLIKNAGTVTTGIKLLVAAFAVKKLWDFTKGVSALGQAFFALIAKLIATSSAEGGLTAAQTALNVAMEANPVGLVVAALGLLVGIIASCVTGYEQMTEKAFPFIDSLNKERDAAAEVNAELAQRSEETRKAIEGDIAQMGYIQNLSDELRGLADEEGNVKDEDKARAEFILNELNEALGTEYELTGNQIENYKDLAQSIDDVIQKKKAELLLNDAAEQYTEAQKNYIKAQEEAINAQDRLNREKKKQKALEAELKKAIEDEKIAEKNGDIEAKNAAYTRQKNLEILIGWKNEEVKATREAYKEQEKAASTYYAQIIQYESAYQAAMEGNVEKTAKILSDSESQFEDIGRYLTEGVASGMSSDEAMSILSKAAGAVANGTIDKMRNELGIKSPSKVAEKVIGQNIVKGIVKGINDEKDNAEKSAAELSKLYVDAAKKRLDRLKSANKLTLAQEVDFWKAVVNVTKKGSDAQYEALKSYREARKELKKETESLSKSLIDEVSKLQNSYTTAVQNRKSNILSSFGLFNAAKKDEGVTNSSLIANLQSQVDTFKTWDKTLNSLEKKIKNKDLIKELQSQGVSALPTLQNIDAMTEEQIREYEKLYKERSKIANKRALTENEELLASVQSQIRDLKKKYVNEIDKLKKSVKDKGKEIGASIAAGIKLGFKEGMENVNKSDKSEINGLITQIKKQLKINSPSKVFEKIGAYMAQGLGGGFLDELQAVRDSIRAEIPTLSAVAAGSTSNVNNTKTVNFTQNNYGNSQMSRYDQWRQTKNLIEMYKRGI